MDRIITTFVCLTTIAIFIKGSHAIRVCPTISDYDGWFNSRCHNSPISYQNITEIINGWGFTAEEHYLTTKDGYQILVERLYSKISQPTPIIIVHGIAMNPLAWVIREKRSIAYLLAQQGYDVWLVNYRGTTYSKRHVRLSPSQKQFWKFNINDMGIYDVRGSVEMVYNKTGKQAIYMGYSMGSTGFFIYATTYPDEAQKYIKGMIGVAPVINFKDTTSLVTRTLVPAWPILKPLTYALWNGEMFPGFSIFLRPLSQFSIGTQLMQTVVDLYMGEDDDQVDPITYPLFVTRLLDTVGAEVFTHYIQIYHAGKFQNYDYGKQENLRRYGSLEPPAYDLSKVPVPVSLFIGENDLISTQTNSKQLYSELPSSSRCGYHVVPFKKWNHVDFLIGKDLQKYLFDDLFEKIKQLANGKCAS